MDHHRGICPNRTECYKRHECNGDNRMKNEILQSLSCENLVRTPTRFCRHSRDTSSVSLTIKYPSQRHPFMLGDVDPFSANILPDLGDSVTAATGESSDTKRDALVHIRVQQRTGRKSITTVSGLRELNYKKLLSEIKKRFACNGSIQDDKEHGPFNISPPNQLTTLIVSTIPLITPGTVLQLQGDQRESIQRFLLEENIVTADAIRVHGF